MSTLLTIILIVFGILALGVGVLVWLFFYQGGCCIRKARAKISRKDYAAPVLKQG
jgi:hypothetical protein